ncbi:MAG: FliM/FliN family flagellar motor switch protein [Opitutales bacterium]
MENDSIDPSKDPMGIDRILDVKVDVTGRLGACNISMREIIEFDVGTIVQLKQSAKDPIELCLNNKVVARGEVVVVNDAFGIKITEMVDQ